VGSRIKEKKSGEASSRGGDGKRRCKASSEKKKKINPNACRRCGKTGHWAAKECPNRKQEKKAKAHLAQADDDDDEATLLMASFCALHDVEGEEKAKEVAMAEQGKDLKAVDLDEPFAQVHLRRVDSDASNHMTGSKAAFSELDGNVTDTVKFGDGSRVAIRGRGTIIFRCQNGEHRILTDVYYIPQLRSSIISIGQLDERRSEVLIKDSVLRIRDWEQRLLTKVKRSRKRLYLLDLKVEQPICLAARRTEPWLWHARFRYLSFDALGLLEKMVHGLGCFTSSTQASCVTAAWSGSRGGCRSRRWRSTARQRPSSWSMVTSMGQSRRCRTAGASTSSCSWMTAAGTCGCSS
jgi:hypothetical protein